jgi:ketosteroid isomerase-like protein
MSEQSVAEQNVAAVQQAYAAFGRGDIEGLLDLVTDDIVWDPVLGASADVPQAGRKQGKADVRTFFRILSETMTFERFEPRDFIAQGDRVVVVGLYRGVVTATERVVESEWVMLFRLRDGKVSEFREFTDSAALNAAYAPRAAAAGR